MDAKAERQWSVAVIDVPLAAIAGARKIRGEVAGGPGLRIAASGDVVEPGSRQYLFAAAGPAVCNQLANQRQIAKGGADAAGGAWCTEAIDGDVGAARRPIGRQINSLIRSAYRRLVARSITQPSRSVFGET